MSAYPELPPKVAAHSRALGLFYDEWLKRQLAAGVEDPDPDDDPEYWKGAAEIDAKYPVR